MLLGVTPLNPAERVDWGLAQAHEIKVILVILVDCKTASCEDRRADFEVADIDLVTGVRSPAGYGLDDKTVLTAKCQAAGLRVVPSFTVIN